MKQMNTSSKPLVAILNTSPDFISVLTEVLDMEGFEIISEYIIKFRNGQKDIRLFFDEHQPHVVVYDVAMPYVENWQFFRHVQELSGLLSCQFIVVTTNKNALDALVGETGSLEIIGKPFDLDALLMAVRASLEQCQ